ncbi:DUF2849 domain-containing protein [Celeribacter persicus]|jgi:Protein of unknown function (DUF2849).|uniref:Uncharacterized protein DUF2849 n=1 Tax=Celeribacter persicus TaxID=1651082 RepID=A0A2T5HBD3_9RHOB|nr:DUF2849 domain-containing protein [Celeribacter persicus]PTQ68884.1 uncharacterized protein DUF2849 [Celeribacter persicus]
MPRPFTPKAVTANALLEGDVIYLDQSGQWVRDLRMAQAFTEAEAAEAALSEAAKDGMVVGAYLTDVKLGEYGPEPAHFREEFRRTGPSNYFHGKQEAEAHV